jgi:hypothetical protein
MCQLDLGGLYEGISRVRRAAHVRLLPHSFSSRGVTKFDLGHLNKVDILRRYLAMHVPAVSGAISHCTKATSPPPPPKKKETKKGVGKAAQPKKRGQQANVPKRTKTSKAAKRTRQQPPQHQQQPKRRRQKSQFTFNLPRWRTIFTLS